MHWSAWDLFRAADIVLAVLAVSAIVNTLIGPQIADRPAPALGLPAAFGRMIVGLEIATAGWAAFVLSLFAVHRPSLSVPVTFTGPGYSVRSALVTPDWGYFIALLACGGIIGGGWWSGIVLSRAASPGTTAV